LAVFVIMKVEGIQGLSYMRESVVREIMSLGKKDIEMELNSLYKEREPKSKSKKKGGFPHDRDRILQNFKKNVKR